MNLNESKMRYKNINILSKIINNGKYKPAKNKLTKYKTLTIKDSCDFAAKNNINKMHYSLVIRFK